MSERGPSEVDELYEVTPEAFIATRSALVRRLKSEGEKAKAARVAARRRPPLTAWALNQVARTTPALVERLLFVGRGLRAAMEQALDGDASGLRQAQAQERSAVDAIVAAADGCLERGGYVPTDLMHQRMAATLRAAIVDESVADQLRQGIVEGDREAPGFGMDALSAPIPPPSSLSEPPGARDLAVEVAAGDDDAGVVEATPAADTDRVSDQIRQDERSGSADLPHAGDGVGEAAQAPELDRRQEAVDLLARADELVAVADCLATEAQRMEAEARAAIERATQARVRADAAVKAAALRRSV